MFWNILIETSVFVLVLVLFLFWGKIGPFGANQLIVLLVPPCWITPPSELKTLFIRTFGTFPFLIPFFLSITVIFLHPLFLAFLMVRMSINGFLILQGNFHIKSAIFIFRSLISPSLAAYMSQDPLLSNNVFIFIWNLTNSFLPIDSIGQSIGFHLASQFHLNQGHSINHIFLTCPYAINLCSQVVNWFSFISIQDLLRYWWSLGLIGTLSFLSSFL